MNTQTTTDDLRQEIVTTFYEWRGANQDAAFATRRGEVSEKLSDRIDGLRDRLAGLIRRACGRADDDREICTLDIDGVLVAIVDHGDTEPDYRLHTTVADKPPTAGPPGESAHARIRRVYHEWRDRCQAASDAWHAGFGEDECGEYWERADTKERELAVIIRRACGRVESDLRIAAVVLDGLLVVATSPHEGYRHDEGSAELDVHICPAGTFPAIDPGA